MKSYIDCIPCIMHNIVATLNGHIANRADREEAFKKILKELHETDFSKVSPPVLTDNLHKIMLTYLDGRDIYKDIKKECNNEALKIYKHAEELYNNSANKLKTAIKIAIAGNLIDYGALKSFNIENILDDYVHRDFAVDDYADLEVEINKANTILYIGDNTGEIVLDRLLVKHRLSIGKKVTFNVKINSIKTKQLPELNDEFVSSLGANYKTISDLKTQIESNIKQDLELRDADKKTIDILNKIVEDSKIEELPERLIQAECKKMLEELKSSIEQNGMEFENYKESIKKTEEQLLEEFKPKAQERLKMSLCIDKIAEQEKIESTEEELNKELENAMKYYASHPDFEKVRDKLTDPAYQGHLRKMIKNEKGIKFLREKNLI